MRQHYTEEEANAILRRAVERQTHDGGMSRAQLEAIASEIGVTPDALDRAESEYIAETEEQGLRRAFNAYRRQEYLGEVLTYIAVNVFLVIMNRVTSPGFFWAIFPILGWGLGIVLGGIKAYQTGGEEYELDFQKWLEKREKKALRSSSQEPGPYPYARP